MAYREKHKAQHDIYHDMVVTALLKDGWTITHDPLVISFGGQNLFKVGRF